ncbi:BRO family protein [Pseudomonas otitidis]|uniref:BRO family protein n=1 Tax=Metapseudomonas otitidis TaxID=319939 RepID=UPI00244D79C9|nr:BRO family protein [Pseudomonas otitidis]MDH1104833.1 BRO family protein [Pseudomonas otitidis]MDH1157120.1 BRO family protein [Pseudomonas otitidis]MDH1164744.1 BRO family protein [Pseudomonas otitidis]
MQTAQVIPFQYEACEIRTVLISDQPWFCATDLCAVLGYLNAPDAIRKHCREAGIAKRDISSGGQKRSVTFINEGNLYRLIIKSRKEEAQRFETWVCDEVLPAIRKHGRYEDPDGRMQTLIDQTIGTDGFHMLGALIKGKVSSLPAHEKRSATAKIWSQTHAAFGVRSAADIPASQLDAARNFIAAYALDGEWLPKERAKGAYELDFYAAQDLNNLIHYTAWVSYKWSQISPAVKALNPRYHAGTWEFFEYAQRAADRLERALPELIDDFRSREGGGLRPNECLAKGVSPGCPAD